MKLTESFAYFAHPSLPPIPQVIFITLACVYFSFLARGSLPSSLARLYDIVCGLERNVCLSSVYFLKSSLLRISPPQTQNILTD